MPAKPGNNHAEKPQEERLKIFSSYCEHVRSGYTKESFPLCDRKTIKRYMELYPDEFPAEKIEEAEREGQKVDEEIGRQGMLGKIPHFNATAWIFWMKNKHGWRDKQEQTIEAKGDVSFRESLSTATMDARIQELIHSSFSIKNG
jgi:hypothetical protein